ncbi:MAG: hypothetical protein SH856_06050 [Flavobacteriales bacterium]|nr:hypothetical protein [Flavobacteriales bacterium]
MTFKQRLLRYLIGVGIGLIIVWVMFGDREWLGWTPKNRVLKMIRAAELTVSEKAQCQLDCMAMKDADIKKFLENASVNFSKSNPHKEPKTYLLEGDEENTLRMTFDTRDSVATLVDVLRVGASCPCK